MDVVVVAHSELGHTLRVAETVRDAAQARLLLVDARGELPAGAWDELAAARAIVFGTPTAMGGPTWQFKRFADASRAAWAAGTWRDKFAAGFTDSAAMNGDKQMALLYLLTLAMQHSMLWIGAGERPADARDARRNDVNYVGAFAGLMTTSPLGTGADAMAPGDLVTARLFGERVAAVTAARGVSAGSGGCR